MKIKIYYMTADAKRLQHIEMWAINRESAAEQFRRWHPEAKAGILVEINEFTLDSERADH